MNRLELPTLRESTAERRKTDLVEEIKLSRCKIFHGKGLIMLRNFIWVSVFYEIGLQTEILFLKIRMDIDILGIRVYNKAVLNERSVNVR